MFDPEGKTIAPPKYQMVRPLDRLGWYRLEPGTVLEPRTKNVTRNKNQERYRTKNQEQYWNKKQELQYSVP